MSRKAKGMLAAGGPLGGLMKNQSRRFDKTTTVSVTFDDIAGLEGGQARPAGDRRSSSKEPERFRRLGGKVPRGVLLAGPPGTGKTLLARAVAGESGVPFFSISASEFIEMFVGLGRGAGPRSVRGGQEERPGDRLHRRDRRGRAGARGAGLGGGNDEREQTLNQLLSEMDGFARTDLVVVIAATNRPDVLDPALLRPGRFDRRVLVDRPELAARKAILGCTPRASRWPPTSICSAIAQNTPGFSGADLANLVNEAALSATRAGRRDLAAADFAEAYDKIVLGDPREAKLDAKEKRRVAVHEAGHAVVAAFSAATEPLHRVTHHPARHGPGRDAAEPRRGSPPDGAGGAASRGCAS